MNGMVCKSPAVGNSFVQQYYQVTNGIVSNRNHNEKGQVSTKIPRPPPTPFLSCLLIHPVKTANDMKYLFNLNKHYIRSVIPSLKTDVNKIGAEYHRAVNDYRKSCVANSAMQIIVTGNLLPNCPNPPILNEDIPSFDDFYIPTYVINLEGFYFAFIQLFSYIFFFIYEYCFNLSSFFLSIYI